MSFPTMKATFVLAAATNPCDALKMNGDDTTGQKPYSAVSKHDIPKGHVKLENTEDSSMSLQQQMKNMSLAHEQQVEKLKKITDLEKPKTSTVIESQQIMLQHEAGQIPQQMSQPLGFPERFLTHNWHNPFGIGKESWFSYLSPREQLRYTYMHILNYQNTLNLISLAKGGKDPRDRGGDSLGSRMEATLEKQRQRLEKEGLQDLQDINIIMRTKKWLALKEAEGKPTKSTQLEAVAELKMNVLREMVIDGSKSSKTSPKFANLPNDHIRPRFVRALLTHANRVLLQFFKLKRQQAITKLSTKLVVKDGKYVFDPFRRGSMLDANVLFEPLVGHPRHWQEDPVGFSLGGWVPAETGLSESVLEELRAEDAREDLEESDLDLLDILDNGLECPPFQGAPAENPCGDLWYINKVKPHRALGAWLPRPKASRIKIFHRLTAVNIMRYLARHDFIQFVGIEEFRRSYSELAGLLVNEIRFTDKFWVVLGLKNADKIGQIGEWFQWAMSDAMYNPEVNPEVEPVVKSIENQEEEKVSEKSQAKKKQNEEIEESKQNAEDNSSNSLSSRFRLHVEESLKAKGENAIDEVLIDDKEFLELKRILEPKWDNHGIYGDWWNTRWSLELPEKCRI